MNRMQFRNIFDTLVHLKLSDKALHPNMSLRGYQAHEHVFHYPGCP